jgi:hypothetical protein
MQWVSGLCQGSARVLEVRLRAAKSEKRQAFGGESCDESFGALDRS